MKKVLVCGAGGFIGSHLVKALKAKDYEVHGVDLKYPEFSDTHADEFYIFDLRSQEAVTNIFKENKYDEVYQLAADMGGAGYIFTGEHDADVMHNSAQINLNIARASVEYNVKKVFYSSSACIYPSYNQEDPLNPLCSEESAYPANPDSEYGWEKLFSERLYKSYERNYGLNVRIARFHNIFGPEGTWKGGKEKAPAAICRKVAESDGGEIEIWGSGQQTRSFLYIDACVEGILRLMDSDCTEVVNIGSEEMISINDLAKMVIKVSHKDNISIKNIDGPVGVAGRNSDNKLIKDKLNWEPVYSLKEGIKKTYHWINCQMYHLGNVPYTPNKVYKEIHFDQEAYTSTKGWVLETED
jgi:nucleoside-diphosphate-sugar epimerase